MSVTVGTLTIDLKASTASFTSEMSKASTLSAKTANDIKRSLEKIGAVGLAMGAAVATGAAAIIKSALDTADSMGKLAQATGTSVETLSVLAYGAKLSGLQVDQLGMGLVRLSKAAFAAQSGNIQLERIFGRMGVSVSDANGHLKDSGELMQQLSGKFSGMADGAGKTAMATMLFGKSGATLIPFLNEYGASQDRVNAAAKRFGLEISTNTATLAGQAKSNIANLKEQFEGLGFAILNTTLPGLVKLSEQILKVAEDAHIPDLARAFGQKVSDAVIFLGNSLEFAEKHAHALKIALEGLVALGAIKIAIPVIADLAGGGLANVGSGIAKMLISFAGLGRVIPALVEFGGWLKYTAGFVGLLASEEGIAAAASYVLGGAFAAIGGPIGLTIAAIAGLGVAIYKFRDSTFSLKGTTYELRDVWSAAWIGMGKALTFVKSEFGKLVDEMKRLWAGFISLVSGNVIVNTFKNMFGEAFDWAKGILGSLVPQFAIDALNEAKRRRLADANKPAPSGEAPAPTHHREAPNTAGMGTPKKDIYGDEIRQLDQAIAQQKAYLGVLDGSPEKIAEVAAAEKARGVILELNNRLTDAGRPKLTALQQATITHKIATEESTKALVDYGKGLVDQQHSADLAIIQTRAIAAANLEGDAAIRLATVDNAILGLTYNKTAAQLAKMAPELAKVRTALTAKSDIEVVAGANRQIDQLRDQLEERHLLTDATLGSIDAQREADLAVKTFSLDQQIASMGAGEARNALIAQRQALINLTEAQWEANDAQAALALLSPADQYDREMDSLHHAVDALTALQKGTLTYGEQLQIAARQQDDFNKLTDDTIALMLREGGAADGVRAFFLEMEKQGKSTAAELYDAFNQAFGKLSEGITAIITAKNRWGRRQAIGQFSNMFEDLGKNLLNSTIKNQMQSGIGVLGKALGINVGGALGGKVDGSTSSNALWVRMASSNGSPLSLFGGAGASSSSGSPSGAGAALAPFFRAPNELDDLLGVPASSGPRSSSSSGGNELDDLFGAPPTPASRSATAPPQSAANGIFGAIGRLLGLKPVPTSSQSGVLGGETLGLPTSSPTGALGGAQPQTGATGAAANVLTSIGRLFGIQPAAKPASSQLPASAVSFLSGPNELDDLSSPASPASATQPETAPLEAIPTLLRRSADAMPGPNGLTAGASQSDSTIPGAPDIQPSTYTLVTKPRPSALDQILQAGIGFGSKILGMAFAGGGRVSGPGTGTSDSINARLSHGEYVINAASTAKHLPMLHAINSDSLPKFALGGFFGFDDGGFVSPSAAYLPASRDFTSMSESSQVGSRSSSALRPTGDTHNWTIDARHSTDPAQITAHLDRYMATKAPQIAAMAVHAVKDQQMRRAPSAR